LRLLCIADLHSQIDRLSGLEADADLIIVCGDLHNRGSMAEIRPVVEDKRRAVLWAESGASLGGTARSAAQQGWSGIEWGATVPGTIGGAVVGNAGAFGGDMAGSLHMASILQRGNRQVGSNSTAVVATVAVRDLGYSYRSSRLKRERGSAVVLSAEFVLTACPPAEALARIETMNSKRRESQPPGASMGSMFKNPPGDFAGRLIEAAGLKGVCIGGAQVSEMHCNFLINEGGATATQIEELGETIRARVKATSGIELEWEIKRIGIPGGAA